MTIIIFPLYLTNIYFLMIGSIYLGVSTLLILLYLTKYSPLEFKAIASLLFFGFTLIFVGIALKYPPVRIAITYPSFIPPILVIIGTLITISPVRFNPKTYRQTLIYWILIGGSTLSIAIFFAIQVFLSGVPAYFFIAIAVMDVFLIFMEFKIIKIIRSQAPGNSLVFKEDFHLYLSMFSRPQKITEEEVTVSKEKKICLVCKNKIMRLNYICPECYSLYCVKCSDVLSELENACWVCETPFDESKLAKFSKREEKIEEEPKIHKQTKIFFYLNPLQKA